MCEQGGEFIRRREGREGEWEGKYVVAGVSQVCVCTSRCMGGMHLPMTSPQKELNILMSQCTTRKLPGGLTRHGNTMNPEGRNDVNSK